MPASCYYLCVVEFAERASYYGCFQYGKTLIPFAISLYMLAIGAGKEVIAQDGPFQDCSCFVAQFKPNISPMVMDQSPHKVAHRVIVDPEASFNSVMLWFYLLINIGACFGVPTVYLAKIVGYWVAYLVPTIL
ncbi:peptide transporter ptr2 [Podospora pseudoanserina]|uniref:Peptide transporter ptr2 n=1 Tax=Podospora pseudoanserina TaxID=2609844 RepID=A0ABR0IS12_9PEZI|nr:peptide transporter ptr2 [Podospora pseudoanserina]